MDSFVGLHFCLPILDFVILDGLPYSCVFFVSSFFYQFRVLKSSMHFHIHVVSFVSSCRGSPLLATMKDFNVLVLDHYVLFWDFRVEILCDP